MSKGWKGKLLRVDLTSGRSSVETIPADWLRDYIGGRGLADRYLVAEMDPAIDPLSPANKLIFATGPLTGTPVPCGARYMVVTKGPLTDAITTSNSGGHWGPELKFAGYDMLILEGKSPHPCYLYIYDDQVELRDASRYWGKGVWETEDGLREETGIPGLRVASIGPAGEKLVRFACIMNEKHRAAGRSGVGAVMGAKNLKAIAVRGTGGVEIADPEAFMTALWAMRAKMENNPVRKAFAEFGTAATIDMTQAMGGLPTRNFQQGQFDEYENLNGNAITDTRLVANKACFACTIACGRVTRLGEHSDKFLVNMHPRNWKMAGEGPEYETAWAVGADCGIGDLDAVIKANWMCNDLGMDPITMGATLAAAMELYETGVITDDMVEMPLRFGSSEALVRMVEATAYREGFGDELAEGSRRMTQRFQHPNCSWAARAWNFPPTTPARFTGWESPMPPATAADAISAPGRRGSKPAVSTIRIRPTAKANGSPTNKTAPRLTTRPASVCSPALGAERWKRLFLARPPRPVSRTRWTISSGSASGLGTWNGCGTCAPDWAGRTIPCRSVC
jgi:aldehyde:ferredoxin oxidoreductase